MRHVELHEHSEETARGTVLLAGWAPAHLDPETAAGEARAIPNSHRMLLNVFKT